MNKQQAAAIAALACRVIDYFHASRVVVMHDDQANDQRALAEQRVVNALNEVVEALGEDA